MKWAFFLAASVCLWTGCKKDPPANPVPFLGIESVTPTTVVEFAEQIDVVLSYEDGDGDLGFFDPDSLALEVLDSRLTKADYYHVQPLAPLTEELHIRGTLKATLSSPFLLGNGNQEVIQYTIRIKDRAGNWSNAVVTPDITITR